MKLRDISRRARAEECPDITYMLQGGLDLAELSVEKLVGFPDTIYVANSQSVVFGKVQKETLLYLLGCYQRFRFQQILDNMNDGVIAVDTTGRIFYANPAYVSILGVPLRRILGKLIQDLEPESILNRALLERETFTREKQLVASVKKHVSLRAFPLWDGETPIGAVSIFQDVTKLHRMNQEIRKMSDIVDEYSQQIRSQEEAERLGITSYNKSLQITIQKAATVALTDVPLLICGESGTGKSTMARYLHQCSSRREKPFIAVNCAAVPDNMIGEVLFGKDGRMGKLSVATGGTLFIDKIDELPMPVQFQLLRLLQRDETDVVSGETNMPDVRLIASTEQPLELMVRNKQFCRDLYFFLNTITVSLPPLRERQDDIIPLANQFLSCFNEQYHRNMAFSPYICQELRSYPWPGNLRELKSYVERAVILADSSLPVIGREEKDDGSNTVMLDEGCLQKEEPLDIQLRAFEAKVIRSTLVDCGGNRTAAMKRLGLSRRTFYRKCADLGVLVCDKK